VRAQIRAGRWKNRTCKSCSYYACARGEVRTKRELQKRKDLKRNPCKRCPARAFLGKAHL
jgi:hypothetical protein